MGSKKPPAPAGKGGKKKYLVFSPVVALLHRQACRQAASPYTAEMTRDEAMSLIEALIVKAEEIWPEGDE